MKMKKLMIIAMLLMLGGCGSVPVGIPDHTHGHEHEPMPEPSIGPVLYITSVTLAAGESPVRVRGAVDAVLPQIVVEYYCEGIDDLVFSVVGTGRRGPTEQTITNTGGVGTWTGPILLNIDDHDSFNLEFYLKNSNGRYVSESFYFDEITAADPLP